jgi:hypothetical protein
VGNRSGPDPSNIEKTANAVKKSATYLGVRRSPNWVETKAFRTAMAARGMSIEDGASIRTAETTESRSRAADAKPATEASFLRVSNKREPAA